MQMDGGQTQLNFTETFSRPCPESVAAAPEQKISATSKPADQLAALTSTPDRSIEQAKLRQERQSAHEVRWGSRERASQAKSPATPSRVSPGGIEKKRARKWKSRAADSRLSSELDRLLVGGSAPAASALQSYAIYRVQHPLRAVLHSLPGFTFDTELDSVKFRKHQRVLFGVEGLMEEGGRDAAKEWLEGFLILTFETIATVLKAYPTCKELDDVPMGFVTMARDVETTINKMPYRPALKSRRAMERRLCQSYDMGKLVDWTMKARQRFLESKPKIIPGFGVFGQAIMEEGSELEKRLWAAVDARRNETTSMHYD